MSENQRLLFITGSTKSNSTNHQLLEYLRKVYQHRMDSRYFDISTLPYFNPDLDQESKLPPSVIEYREALQQCAGLVICTPEYVFSLPGVLKNALEWMVSTVLLTDKPVAYIVASADGSQALASLETILSTLQAQTKPAWKLLVSGAKGKVRDGIVIDPETKQRLDRLMVDFHDAITSIHS